MIVRSELYDQNHVQKVLSVKNRLLVQKQIEQSVNQVIVRSELYDQNHVQKVLSVKNRLLVQKQIEQSVNQVIVRSKLYDQDHVQNVQQLLLDSNVNFHVKSKQKRLTAS